MDIEKIIDAVSVFADYIENFTVESKERDIAVTKLEEAVFWLTYTIENDEEV
jgi:hypothetical protein